MTDPRSPVVDRRPTTQRAAVCQPSLPHLDRHRDWSTVEVVAVVPDPGRTEDAWVRTCGMCSCRFDPRLAWHIRVERTGRLVDRRVCPHCANEAYERVARSGTRSS